MKLNSLRKMPRTGWLALAVAGFLVPLTVYSVVNDDVFELDGNAITAGNGDDWDQVANGTDSATPGVFVQDTIPPGTDRIFIGGGSKDERDISGANSWSHTDGTPPDKNDIEHAFAAAYNDGGDLVMVQAGLGQGLDHHRALGGEDFHRVMFDPASLWVVLREFTLGGADHVGVTIEDDRPGTGGALIEGNDVVLILNVGHVDCLERVNGGWKACAPRRARR